MYRGGLTVAVEGPLDHLAVDVAGVAGVAPFDTALTNSQPLSQPLYFRQSPIGLVVAADADAAGQQAAAAPTTCLRRPSRPARRSIAGRTGPDLDVGHLGVGHADGPAGRAEPRGRQLVKQPLGARDLTWVEDKIDFDHEAAGILSHACPRRGNVK